MNDPQNYLFTLKEYCQGNAEAESGAGIIDYIFVDDGVKDNLYAIENMFSGAPKLLIGNKGVGKTILIRKLEEDIKNKGHKVISIKPSDIFTEDPPSTAPAGMQAFYYNHLIRAIAIELGKRINVAWTKEQKDLLALAKKDGERGDDFIEKCFSFICDFTKMVKPVLDTSCLDELKKIPQASSKSLQIDVKKNIDNSFFLIIDEPDEVSLDAKEVEHTWAFLLAAKKICERINTIKCVISIRNEKWNLIRSSGKCNTDHFDGSLIPLVPTEEEIKKIIKKRFTAVATSLNHSSTSDEIQLFFDQNSTILPPPATTEKSLWIDYLAKQSFFSPRNSIRLIAKLAENAMKKKQNLICSSDVNDCALSFSKMIKENLCREYSNDFSDLTYILNDFYIIYKEIKKFEFDTANVKEFLKKEIRKYQNLSIRGKKINKEVDGVFILWKFLHEVGFLNPRIPDVSQSLGYRFIYYSEREDFISTQNFNQEMNKVCWEIHPVFRSYLYDLSLSEERRIGMLEEGKRNGIKPSPRTKRKRKKY